MLRINLGSGAVVWPDFLSSDIEPYAGHGGVVYVDMAKPLPYADCSVSVAMMSHSYILWGHGTGLLKELYRVLVPGGWIRIDDHPGRAYLKETERDETFGRCFPRWKLTQELLGLGFCSVSGIDSNTTLIPESPRVQSQIVTNKGWHHSFTIEARKPF